MTILSKSALHHSLNDPVMDTVSFLNEVMDRYPDAISFAPGAPNPAFFDDFDVSKAIARYIDHLMQEKGLTLAQARRQLYQYGPTRGHINDLVAQSLGLDHGIHVSPESIVITVGCQEAMLLAVRALCATRNDLLAVVNPRFVGIAGAACILDVQVVGVDEIDGNVDCDDLRLICRAAQRDGHRVRALYVAPDFSNPSGTMLDLDARRALLKVAEDEDFLILEDNAYGFTADPAIALPTLKALDESARVLYLGTFSKICLPGVRVGFVVADQIVKDVSGKTRLLADELAAIKGMITVNTSPVAQAVIAGMLLDHSCSLTSVGRDKSMLYQRNLKLLLGALERHLGGANDLPIPMTWNAPRGGFFVTMHLPVAADSSLLKISASQYGVLWTPMSSFYLGHAGDNQVRLSCSYLTPEQIEEGVRRLALFLRDERVFGHDVSKTPR
jgi:(S)-3,5-dihydroxyphenylglycine transaminase